MLRGTLIQTSSILDLGWWSVAGSCSSSFQSRHASRHAGASCLVSRVSNLDFGVIRRLSIEKASRQVTH
jgi:hypothetical protein